MIHRFVAPTALLAAMAMLAGCGQKADLAPLNGQGQLVAAVGSDQQPNAEDLLKPRAQAVPERSVELRKRSEEREDDPFDLPPQ